MSTATIEIDPISSDEAPLQYRALHSGSLIGLGLGIVSIFAMFTTADSLGGSLLVAPIPLMGIIVSTWSLIKVRNHQDQFTGASLAKFGLILSFTFLIGGVGYASYVYTTEVPDGYQRISFNAMKPDELQERSGLAVPPEIAALEGQKIFIKGYIRQDSVPVMRGIDRFLLVRDNNQCCFGDLSKVKYYDQISVEMTGDHRVDYAQRVFRIGGILHIEPQYIRPGSPKPVFSLKSDYAK